MMKVGLITDCIDNGPPSFALYCRKLVENLSKLVDLTLIHNQKTGDPLYTLASELVINKSPHFLYEFLLPLRLRKYKLDLVHIPHLGSGDPPPALSSLLKSKIVVTLHGTDWMSYGAKAYFGGLNGYFLYPLLFINSFSIYGLMKRETKFHMITVSKAAKINIMRHLKIPEEKISVVYHGVDHKIFKSIKNLEVTKEELRQRYGISKPFILHVSSCHLLKNVSTLVRAFLRFKRKYRMNHKLVICGERSRNSEKIMELVSNLKLSEEVMHIGYISRIDLSNLYNVADLSVFPSIVESFGLPLLEAMACGCPVIASNVFSLPEVADNAAFLFNPYSVDELATGMYEVLTNEKLKKDLKRKGLKRAKMFSWEKCVIEHYKVYEKILG